MNADQATWLTRACYALFLATLCAMSAAAGAATYRLEELPVAGSGNEVTLLWNNAHPSRPAQLEGRLVVPIKLHTAPWQGRSARVYLSVPSQVPGNIGVAWTSAANGPMLPGRLVPGQRRLVFSGVLPTTLQDSLAFQFEADGAHLSRPQRLQINFEIDVE